MKSDTFDFKSFPPSFHQLRNIYLHFYNKTFSMKPVSFDFNPLPSCYTYTLSTILSLSSFAFK